MQLVREKSFIAYIYVQWALRPGTQSSWAAVLCYRFRGSRWLGNISWWVMRSHGIVAMIMMICCPICNIVTGNTSRTDRTTSMAYGGLLLLNSFDSLIPSPAAFDQEYHWYCVNLYWLLKYRYPSWAPEVFRFLWTCLHRLRYQFLPASVDEY